MTTDMVPVRWGDGRRADSDFARDQILNAALCCYQKNTFQKTRMEHIARAAKVSRTTIYRYFQSRDEVVVGLVFRELHELIDLIAERVGTKTCFAEFLVEMLALTNERVPYSPIFGLIMRETTVLMSRIFENSAEIFALASRHLRPRFDAAHAAGELREGIDFDEFADWITRIGSTFVMVPSLRHDSNSFRQMLWRYLIPAIVREDAIPPDKREKY